MPKWSTTVRLINKVVVEIHEIIPYLWGRPDFTRTTKKWKSAIRSIEYTIKKESQRLNPE